LVHSGQEEGFGVICNHILYQLLFSFFHILKKEFALAVSLFSHIAVAVIFLSHAVRNVYGIVSHSHITCPSYVQTIFFTGHSVFVLHFVSNGAFQTKGVQTISIQIKSYHLFSQASHILLLSVSFCVRFFVKRQLSIFGVTLFIFIFHKSSIIHIGFLIPSLSISSSHTSHIPSLSVSF